MATDALIQKWQPVLEHNDLPEIKDAHKRTVVAQLLENQEMAAREQSVHQGGQFGTTLLGEAAPTNAMGASSSTASSGSIDTFDPVLISLVRRSMPNLIAYDICGVQPMTGPTGLIFAMRARYNDYPSAGRESQSEAMGINEVRTGNSATNGPNSSAGVDADPSNDPFAGGYDTDTVGGMSTATAEALGDSSSNAFNEMSFTIEKATVTAKSRALKAEYTLELAQDLKAIHGLDAESELANILSSEILAEINREVVREVNLQAKTGASGTTVPGVFDLQADADGRWSAEKFKGLVVQLDLEANAIAKATR